MHPLPTYSLRKAAQMLYTDIPRIIDTLDRRFEIHPPASNDPMAQFRQLLGSRALASLFYSLLQNGAQTLVLARLHPHPIERCCETLGAAISALQASGYHSIAHVSARAFALPPSAAKAAIGSPPVLRALLVVINTLPEDAPTPHPQNQPGLRYPAIKDQGIVSLLPALPAP